jgi:hypothetical protein
MDMSVQKLNFVQEFLRLNNDQIVNKLIDILHQEKRKLYAQEFQPMSIDEFNNMINDAESDVKQGNVMDANKLLKDVNSWT